VLAHLQALTWQFEAEGTHIWALAPYAHPESLPDGTVRYHIRRAAESGDEGLACVDDAARAALLALALVEARGGVQGADGHAGAQMTQATARVPVGGAQGGGLDPAGEALRWAERWLTFVRYMQLADGRFANFVLDESGQRNLHGPTSAPGGLWWTGRALWALARAIRITGSRWALEAWERCPLPDLGDAYNTRALFALAGLELLMVDPAACPVDSLEQVRRLQARARGLVERCCEAIVAGGPHYFRDRPGQAALPLWGYHQLHAVARAAAVLGRDDFVAPCVATVEHLVELVVAAQGLFAYDPVAGGTKEGVCAYCLSPITQGLGALYDITGEERYRALALEAAAWLYGRNDAHKALYDPTSGRCSDGLDGPGADRPSPNFGAESSIEAGFMEVERRRLAGSARTAEAQRSAGG
jgi:hypothetical protein